MGTNIDKDSLNWLFRLLAIGTALIALFSLFDNALFIFRALGNLFVFGALFFLIDMEAGSSFKRFYLLVLIIWGVVLCHSVLGFVEASEQANYTFLTITFFIYAITLLSLPLFSVAMGALCGAANASEFEEKWKKLTKFSAFYYALPFLAFLIVSIGRALGAEVNLTYGVTDTSPISAEVLKYGLRLLFFVPPVWILINLAKVRSLQFPTSIDSKDAVVGDTTMANAHDRSAANTENNDLEIKSQ
ncbi:MAG TPA: hypothetical protein VL633_02975 [Bacteroidota bacterium]|jgi:hypothetical protein|nr:hypothetical protein [Bacteroidota bacterium]